ncbi:hypothetical protein F0562_024681 [Nyssa sinensis]|uniref:CRC domain-containing protein n=1 Tax=Nyssa sinensis TaxID=561372 RepID=A0A5J5BDI8_9ASTE|nr:hypothetical protein F0562_024681 [Nyssa sinensis]
MQQSPESDAIPCRVDGLKVRMRISRQKLSEFKGLPLTVALPLREQSKSPPEPKSESHSPSYQPTHAPLFAVKSESPIIQSHTNTGVKDDTPKEQKHCKCKQSRCLKLYCECFATGTYCDGCSCTNCQNNVENEAVRQAAVRYILERNPKAFRPKIARSPHRTEDSEAEAKNAVILGKHNRGCNCKKSGCLKRYFPFKNPERETDQEKFLGSRMEDPPSCRLAQYQQVDHISTGGPSSPLSVLPVRQIVSSASLGTSKFTYRSLLAGTIQPQDMRDLCSILVVVSEAVKILADKNGSSENGQTEREIQAASFLAAQKGENCREAPEAQKAMPNGHLNGNWVCITGKNDPRSRDADVQNERPISPGTLALMCDEKDTLFTPDVSLDRILNNGRNTDVYVEQERFVLAKFWECLNWLITRGNIKETECFLSAGGKTEDDKLQSVSNDTLKAGTEMAIEQESMGDDIIKCHDPDNSETSPTSSAATITFQNSLPTEVGNTANT